MRYSIHLILSILAFILVSSLSSLQAQEKLSVRMNMYYFKTSDSLRQIEVKATARINKKRTGVKGLDIQIYQTEISNSNLLGTINTDESGLGRISFSNTALNMQDSASSVIYIAVINDQEGYKDAEKELEIVDGFLELQFEEEDTICIVTSKLYKLDTNNFKLPVEGIPVKLFVKRPFGELPIPLDEEVTNEIGELQVLFPNDIPADTLDQLTVIARVEDDDIFGTLESSEIINWGAEREYDDKTIARSLWASGANAPMSLLIFVNSLILAVWGIILYVIFLIYRIAKTDLAEKKS